MTGSEATMTAWRRRGRIFSVEQGAAWMRTHASVPCAEVIAGTEVRVWFSSRDERGRSQVGWFRVDLERPERILEVSAAPELGPGELGAFDDSGAMATWLTRSPGGERLLYYIGWNLGVTVPFRNSIGLAVGDPGGTALRRAFAGPIVDRTAREPHFTASCCVLPGTPRWRMWYLACTGWSTHEGKARHHYHLRYATSTDGVDWDRDGRVAIDFADDTEYAISRPSVVRDGELWRMWYSYRGQAYRIGYAESADGETWKRLDRSPLSLDAATGWESDMVEYPHVFDCGGRRWMLYNGNDYGRTGIGLAVLDDALAPAAGGAP